MKIIYYYIDEVGMEHFFSDPLMEQELIINGYRFLRSERVDAFPWDDNV